MFQTKPYRIEFVSESDEPLAFVDRAASVPHEGEPVFVHQDEVRDSKGTLIRPRGSIRHTVVRREWHVGPKYAAVARVVLKDMTFQ